MWRREKERPHCFFFYLRWYNLTCRLTWRPCYVYRLNYLATYTRQFVRFPVAKCCKTKSDPSPVSEIWLVCKIMPWKWNGPWIKIFLFCLLTYVYNFFLFQEWWLALPWAQGASQKAQNCRTADLGVFSERPTLFGKGPEFAESPEKNNEPQKYFHTTKNSTIVEEKGRGVARARKAPTHPQCIPFKGCDYPRECGRLRFCTPHACNDRVAGFPKG